jgi:hypothetical protein
MAKLSIPFDLCHSLSQLTLANALLSILSPVFEQLLLFGHEQRIKTPGKPLFIH